MDDGFDTVSESSISLRAVKRLKGGNFGMGQSKIGFNRTAAASFLL